MKFKGYIILLLFMLSIFIVTPAYAEYANGDCIFAEDLPVGAILNEFSVSGNGVSNISHEAVVVRSGNSPRFVLTTNHGNRIEFDSLNTYHGSPRNNYNNNADLKSCIDNLSFSIANHITNISAPSVAEVTNGISYEDYQKSDYFRMHVFLQELRTGEYWTRSPNGKSSNAAW